MLFRVVYLLSALFTVALCQQYQGRTIPLTGMPTTTGSEITFFNIKDANGQNTTLINYFSLPTTTKKRQNPADVKRLVIILTGSNRDAWNYFSNVFSALTAATKINPDVNQESVAIMAPWWANTQDSSHLPASSDALVWDGTGWSGGDNNVRPTNQTTVSSFDALDQILQYFDDKSIYPNLNQLIVAGHSRGAQMTQRYAAVGKELGLNSPIRWWVANPNSFLFFNATRPLSTASCPIFNNWREGLASYTNPYENDFVNSDPAGVLARWNSRNVALARGLNDHGDASDDCAPSTTGKDRGVRFLNFILGFPPTSTFTVDYNAGVGHDAATMMAQTDGLNRLFFDNWNGDGSRAADFGARQVFGDNPHPVAT